MRHASSIFFPSVPFRATRTVPVAIFGALAATTTRAGAARAETPSSTYGTPSSSKSRKRPCESA